MAIKIGALKISGELYRDIHVAFMMCEINLAVREIVRRLT